MATLLILNTCPSYYTTRSPTGDSIYNSEYAPQLEVLGVVKGRKMDKIHAMVYSGLQIISGCTSYYIDLFNYLEEYTLLKNNLPVYFNTGSILLSGLTATKTI